MIREAAFGPGAPDCAVRVSPQHRVLVVSAHAELTFGAPELLVPAKAMVDGVTVVTDARDEPVEYIHLLFDRHEIIWANGLPTESFYPADLSLKGVDAAAGAEILKLFPDILIQPWAAARPMLTVAEARVLRSV